MDAARSSNRKYPSYTLAELEAFVANGKGSELMLKEIDDRKTGRSAVFAVPQIDGGKPVTKIGRM